MADLGLQDRPPIPQSKALASGLPNTVDSGMLCGTDTLPYRRLPLSQSIRPRLTYIGPLKSSPPGGARPPTRLPNRLCRRRLRRLVGTRDRGGVGGIFLIVTLPSHSHTSVFSSNRPPCRHNPHLASGLWSTHKHRRDWAYKGVGGTIIIHFSGHHRSRPLLSPHPTTKIK